MSDCAYCGEPTEGGYRHRDYRGCADALKAALDRANQEKRPAPRSAPIPIDASKLPDHTAHLLKGVEIAGEYLWGRNARRPDVFRADLRAWVHASKDSLAEAGVLPISETPSKETP